MELTEKQWLKIFEILNRYTKPSPIGKGRPRQNDNKILQGILWVLKTGARWKDMPKTYPPYQTCHRRFQEWIQDGILLKAMKQIAIELEDDGILNLAECFIDASFSSAKKGGKKLAKPNAEKVLKLWQSQMNTGYPLQCQSRAQALMKQR